MTDADKRLDELSVLMGQYEDNSKTLALNITDFPNEKAHYGAIAPL